MLIKRLGNRHIQKDVTIQYCMYGFDRIVCNTNLNPIQRIANIILCVLNIIYDENF